LTTGPIAVGDGRFAWACAMRGAKAMPAKIATETAGSKRAYLKLRTIDLLHPFLTTDERELPIQAVVCA
jgi:hypothetical protein